MKASTTSRQRGLLAAPILIAGAGIGGLATARALALRGIASHVLEKRATLSEDGAGIQIGPNGVHVLRQLGVADALAPTTAAPRSLCMMDGISGRALAELPLGASIEHRHGAPYWSAHRADLHAALLAAVRDHPLITLSLGSEVVAAASERDGVRAQLASGKICNAAALIAAGGLWSRLHPSGGTASPLRYAGFMAYRAVIPVDKLPLELSAVSTCIWLNAQTHAVHYPVRAGREIAIVAIVRQGQMGVGWGTEVAASVVRAHFASSTPALRDLITRPAVWRGWPLMKPAHCPPWVAGRTALLGDAAHPILPFLAQGAVMALEDAVVLADQLARNLDDIPHALATYATARRARTQRVARASARNGNIYHLSGALAAVRNAVLRATPPHRLVQAFDWLYGWRADKIIES